LLKHIHNYLQTTLSFHQGHYFRQETDALISMLQSIDADILRTESVFRFKSLKSSDSLSYTFPTLHPYFHYSTAVSFKAPRKT